MPAVKRAAGAAILYDLADLMDFARSKVRDLPASRDPSHAELLEALAVAHVCALRLLAERTRKRRRR